MNHLGGLRQQQGFSQLLDSWEKRSSDNADLMA
ncbi:hypothetical protein LCGC14_2499110, partial [marine sediment metagenome]